MIADTNINYIHVGVDLSKKFFQVAYKSPSTGKFHNRQLNRSEFMSFLIEPNAPRMLVAMEACGSCHYWSRLCQECGHKPMILPAEITHSINIGNKDDCNDAKAIWQASSIPDIKQIRVRSELNQIEGMELKTRNRLMATKTKLLNFLRSELYELGVTCGEGQKSIEKAASILIEGMRESKSPGLKTFSGLYRSMMSVIVGINKEIDSLTKSVECRISEDDLCKRLCTIPYVGPITAAGLAYVMDEPHNFKDSRQYADYCGMAPYHTGTGGKVSVLGITRKGERILKQSLYEAALGLCQRVKSCRAAEATQAEAKALAEAEEQRRAAEKSGKEPPKAPKVKKSTAKHYESDWISDLLERKPLKKAVCATANKLCRIAWAIAITPGAVYDSNKTSLVNVKMI